MSVVSKCYTSILNNRLYNWLEENDKLVESQVGFRKGYCATDHIFSLYAIIQTYLSKPSGRFYAAFVDLRKAYDSATHSTLFRALLRAGTSSSFIKAIMVKYKNTAACVRANNNLTDFDCPCGLKQGCVASPTLFSIIINEIAIHVQEGGKHGMQLLPGLVELLILLFADDVILMSVSQPGLQKQLDCLQEACEERNL